MALHNAGLASQVAAHTSDDPMANNFQQRPQQQPEQGWGGTSPTQSWDLPPSNHKQPAGTGHSAHSTVEPFFEEPPAVHRASAPFRSFKPEHRDTSDHSHASSHGGVAFMSVTGGAHHLACHLLVANLVVRTFEHWKRSDAVVVRILLFSNPHGSYRIHKNSLARDFLTPVLD